MAELFDTSVFEEWFVSEMKASTSAEAFAAEAAFRRIATAAAPLANNTLASLGLIHGLAGNRDRALVIAKELEKRDVLTSHERLVIAVTYQAAGFTRESLRQLILLTFQEGRSNFTDEDAGADGDPAAVAEAVSQMLVREIDHAPHRGEALLSLAKWLGIADGKDTEFFSRITLPRALILELLQLSPVDGDFFQWVYLGRIHERFGTPAGACRYYRKAYFDPSYEEHELGAGEVRYFRLRMVIKNVDVVWEEYSGIDFYFIKTDPHHFDLTLLFAEKFIEKGQKEFAKILLKDVLGRDAAVLFKDRAQHAVSLLVLCAEDPDEKKLIKTWQVKLAAMDSDLIENP